jgi:phosphoribosylpyrophosphate synthetase
MAEKQKLKAHVISCNDTAKFVVVGDEKEAVKVCKQLADKHYKTVKYKYKDRESYDNVLFWHIHTVEYKILVEPGNLNIPPDEWLNEHFECQYCDECGGDAIHHTAVPFMGNWFARCDYPMPDDNQEHPVIKTYKAEKESNDD